MPTCLACLACGANLSPKWKYCIYCGAIAATVPPRRRSARVGVGVRIPPAIRPDATVEAPSSRLDPRLLVGIVLGLVGTAIIVYITILLLGPK